MPANKSAQKWNRNEKTPFSHAFLLYFTRNSFFFLLLEFPVPKISASALEDKTKQTLKLH